MEEKTCANAFRHELGVVSQRLRADAAALKFRNNILGLDGDDHLVKRVYLALLNDHVGQMKIHKNGARVLEALASKANWTSVLSKAEAKKAAHEYVTARQNEDFAEDLVKKSKAGKTLVGMRAWTDADRLDLAEYLRRPCPLGLCAGRRLKTKFRLGCHPLQESATRKQQKRDSTCRCCSSGAAESVAHAMFECPAHDEIRRVFVDTCSNILPEFAEMNTEDRLRLLMSDDTPSIFDEALYLYLIKLTASRESRLGILAAQEKGS